MVTKLVQKDEYIGGILWWWLVQWLGLQASNERGMGLMPQAMQLGQREREAMNVLEEIY